MANRGAERNKALRQKLDELLKVAIAEGNYREVARLAKMAEEAVALDEREKEIAERRDNLLTFLQADAQNVPADTVFEPRQVSARERGNRVRAVYIDAWCLFWTQSTRVAPALAVYNRR